MTGPKLRKAWKRKDVKDSDNLVPIPGARDTDVIIPVMGQTGSGRSTFINAAAGKEVTRASGDLESCTSTILPVIIPFPGMPERRIIFVDTPGFDDTYIDDTEILRRIAVWMAFAYDENMKLAGVIYLHEISQTRMLGSSRKNFVMFNRLTGQKAVKSVVLATTKWDEVEKDVGIMREEQLSATYWHDMLEQGSRMSRFLNTYKSAWDIVDQILETGVIEALAIQEELVDLQKRVRMTEAASAMRNPLRALREKKKALAGRFPELLASRPPSKDIDVVILVMGPTGAGKSTFINAAAGKCATPVGHDLDPCTSTILPVNVPHPRDLRCRITFVDTPGFNGTPMDSKCIHDQDILKSINSWITKSYRENAKLAGVVYLYEITQTRVPETLSEDFEAKFNQLPGKMAVKSVVLATTKWNEVGTDVGEKREQQLSAANWKSMLDQGSHMRRCLNTHQSAWDIVDVILKAGESR